MNKWLAFILIMASVLIERLIIDIVGAIKTRKCRKVGHKVVLNMWGGLECETCKKRKDGAE